MDIFRDLKPALRSLLLTTRGCVHSQIVYHIFMLCHRLLEEGYHLGFQRIPNGCAIPHNKADNLASKSTHASTSTFIILFSRTDAAATINAEAKHAYSSLGALLNYDHIYVPSLHSNLIFRASRSLPINANEILPEVRLVVGNILYYIYHINTVISRGCDICDMRDTVN